MTGCLKCGVENKDGAKFCKGCGASLTVPQALKPCIGCGIGLPVEARFCKKCGTPAAPSEQAQAVLAAQPANASADTATVLEHEGPDAAAAPLLGADQQSGVASAAAASAPAFSPAEQPSEQPPIQHPPAPVVSVSDTVTPAPAATRAAAPAIADDIDTATVQAPPAANDGSAHTITSPARAASPDTRTADQAMANAAPAAPAKPSVHETPIVPQTRDAADDVMGAPTGRKSPVSPILAIGAVAIAVACAGGFYWWHGAKQSARSQTVDADPATSPGSGAQSAPSTPSPPAAPEAAAPASRAAVTNTPAAAPAAPLPVEPGADKAANAPATPVPAAPAGQRMPLKATPLPDDLPKPAPGQRSAAARRNEATVASPPPAAKSDPIAAKVSTLLVKADSYIANRQYDKAIATAESALELDPGNSGARAMISIAKSRQTEALRSGSSLE